MAEYQDSTLFIWQFFKPVIYAETNCGRRNRNWALQVNCTIAEDPGVYLGEEIFYVSCWNNRFPCDSEKTVVILPMEHLDFPDQQV